MPRVKSGVWQHCEIFEKDGKKFAKCVFCLKEYSFPNATRLTEHMLVCAKCPHDIKKSLKKKSLRKKTPYDTSNTTHKTSNFVNRLRQQEDENENNQNDLSSHSTLQDSENEPPMETNTLHEQIDAALARAAYATGMPLCCFENKYWSDALKLLKLDYKPPTKYAMSNALLDAEYYRIKNDMDEKIKKTSSLGLISDGWTNVRGRGVVNFIITTPQPIFWSSIYPGIQRETGEYIKEQVRKVMDEVGAEKFVALVTDNASNMRAAWRQIQAHYNHIDCIGCAAHGLNLLFGDIMKINCFKTFFTQCKNVIKHINRRHVCLAVFEELQKEKYGSQYTTLKLPSKTRWAGAIATFKSLIVNREALEALVITNGGAHVDRDIKQTILSDCLWSQLKVTEDILLPISTAIHNIESDNALLSEVPAAFLIIENKIQKMNFPDDCPEFENSKDTILTYVKNRKEFCIQPMHLAAYMLDPRFHKSVFTEYETLTDNDFLKMAQYLTKLAECMHINTCDLMGQFAEYQAKGGFWANEFIWQPVTTISPLDWWKGLCATKLLSTIAVRLLSVPPSSAASERNWSLFGRTHTKDRNRLLPERLNKLIYIRSNLHLQINCSSVDDVIDSGVVDLDDGSDSD